MYKSDYVVIAVFSGWTIYCVYAGAYILPVLFLPLVFMFDFFLWGIVRRVREKLRGSVTKRTEDPK